MPFPSTISSFTYPNPTQRLNNPSQSSVIGNLNDAVLEVQRAIGTDASTLGTIIGDLRSASSGGGGHIQSANKGGTGQTAYTKGDLLVAQSASALGKLAVGTDGQILQANSSTASGVNWVNNNTPKIAVSVVGTTFASASVSETSILSITVPGSVLGTGNAVRATVFIGGFGTGGPTSVLVKTNYGATATSSVLLVGDGNGPANRFGTIEHTLFAAGANAQVARTIVGIRQNELLMTNSSVTTAVHAYLSGSASVVSSANQTLGMTVRFSNTDASNGIKVDGFVIEKIT